MKDTTRIRLDSFYAAALGCAPAELRAGRVVVAESDLERVWFAKARPLLLYGLTTTEGTVIAARLPVATAVRQAVQGAAALDEATWEAMRRAVSALVPRPARLQWFTGVRLVCEPEGFKDCAVWPSGSCSPAWPPSPSGSCSPAGSACPPSSLSAPAALRSGDAKPADTAETREISPAEDLRAAALHSTWGGKVFGRLIDGQVVSWVAVKPLSEVVWDLSVETLPEHRGQGHAKWAVSLALRFVFQEGRLAGWGCDRDNMASLAVARAVGFEEYALDFGCAAGGAAGPWVMRDEDGRACGRSGSGESPSGGSGDGAQRATTSIANYGGDRQNADWSSWRGERLWVGLKSTGTTSGPR